MTVEDQVAIIYLGTKGLLSKVPVNRVREFEKEFIAFMNENHRDVLDTLQSGKLTDDATSTLEKVAADLSSKYAQ
jgi:F-type H+-transporting ATPase subunit alpha